MAMQLELGFGDEAAERWLPVVDIEGWYDVSDWGRLRSWRRNGKMPGRRTTPHLMTPSPHVVDGYPQVCVRTPGGSKTLKVHLLVLNAFIGPCPKDMEARHLDGDPMNARLDNLAWGTHAENCADMFRHGTRTRYQPVEPDPIMFFDSFIPVESILPWEAWKPIANRPGYEVSNLGRARSFWVPGKHRLRTNAKILKPAFVNGYPAVSTYATDDRKPLITYIHSVMLNAFSPSPSPELVCRHLDGNRSNAHLSNLRWGTQAENIRDAIHHKTLPRGEKHGRSKLLDSQVDAIRDRLAKGESAASLAREFGVGDSTISRIRYGIRKTSHAHQ